MHPNNRTISFRPTRRRGFTIVELLIVIAIIAVLFTLTVKAVGVGITYSRQAATEATIRKINAMLTARSEALHRLIKRSNFVESTPEYQIAGIYLWPANQPNIQRIIAIKLLERKYFPQRYQEVEDARLMGVYFNAGSPQPNITAAGAASSAEILYDFLTQSNVLGDQVLSGDSFSTSEVRDTDGDGLPEFVDAWGHPLRFYRWPTRLFRTGGQASYLPANPMSGVLQTQQDVVNAKVLFSSLVPMPNLTGTDADPVNDPIRRGLARDPDDPLRRMVGPFVSNFETTGITANGSDPKAGLLTTPINGPVFHTPVTFHLMMVVSSGPDETLGLYEPEDTTNYGHLGAVNTTLPDNPLYDDITYLNMRTGGK